MTYLRVGLLAAIAISFATAASGSEILLKDVAVSRGVDFEHQRAVSTRLWFPEIMSGGGGWLDYDQDGDLDLYLVQGGELDPRQPRAGADRLYRNDGARFLDVTEFAIGSQDGYGMGLAVGDYDRDGDPDIYLTQVGPNRLLRNRGDGTFEDVTESAGVGDPSWGTSALFVDYDGDSDLDLFVVNYIHWSSANEIECFTGGRERDYCHPTNYNAPAADRLYRNDGEGAFTDVTRESGVADFFGNGLGLAAADFDNNGLADVFVANDGMANQLWMSPGGGRLVNEAVLAGTAVNRFGTPEAGMGVVAGDFNGDALPDIFLTHLRDETNTLYLNSGGWFDDVTAARGLGAASIGSTGFGTVAADFDLDGELDLYIANGRVGRTDVAVESGDPFAEPNQIFRGLEGGAFELTKNPVETPMETSRGLAVGDYDLDGDPDLVVINNGGRARVLDNQSEGGRWLRVRTREAWGAPAVGTELSVRASEKTRHKRVDPGYSYCSSNDPAPLFGLAEAARVEMLEARWVDGKVQRWLALPPSRDVTLFRATLK